MTASAPLIGRFDGKSLQVQHYFIISSQNVNILYYLEIVWIPQQWDFRFHVYTIKLSISRIIAFYTILFIFLPKN